MRFIILSNLLPPLTCYSIQCVDVHLFPEEMFFLLLFFGPSLLFGPIGQKAAVYQIDLRLITEVLVVQAHFPFPQRVC